MRLSLLPHPTTPAGPVERLTVEVARHDAMLALDFCLTGDLAAIAIPPPGAARRTDGLWRHSCFEAFLASPGGGYREYNLSPSGAWAAYRFDAYRSGMADDPDADPTIAVSADATTLALKACVPIVDAVRLGLAAVVAARDGTIGYWALAHPPGAPDFHHDVAHRVDLEALA
jgi:hypothetical protein